MTDVADLVAVLGALDHAVARLAGDERATAQRRVAAFFDAYGAPDAVGWYDRFLDPGEQAQAPDLDHALRDLARPTDDHLVAARRLAAIGAAALAFPGWYGPAGDHRDVTLHALAGPGILAGGPRVGDDSPSDDAGPPADLADAAEEVLATLVETRVDSARALHEANRDRLQDDLLRALPRVSTRLVDTVVDGDVDPTPALTLRICVRGLSLDQAGAVLLDPTNWTRVPEWCAMVPAPPDSAMPEGFRRYLEEVSLDCGGSSHRYRVWLDFSPVRPWGDRLVVTYRMSPPEVQHDLVVDGVGANGTLGLDEGSLVVGAVGADSDDDLRLITTKRLRHASDAVGRAVFKMADVAGFYELGARFVTNVSEGEAHVEECPDDNANE